MRFDHALRVSPTRTLICAGPARDGEPWSREMWQVYVHLATNFADTCCSLLLTPPRTPLHHRNLFIFSTPNGIVRLVDGHLSAEKFKQIHQFEEFKMKITRDGNIFGGHLLLPMPCCYFPPLHNTYITEVIRICCNFWGGKWWPVCRGKWADTRELQAPL